jgi:hypothetical protein
MFIYKYLKYNDYLSSSHHAFPLPYPGPQQANQFVYLSTFCILPGAVYINTIEGLYSSPYATTFIQPKFHLSLQLLPQQEP